MRKTCVLGLLLFFVPLVSNCNSSKSDMEPIFYGDEVWARSVAAGTSESAFNSLAAGSDGVYAAGYISGTGTYTFGAQSVAGAHTGRNILLVKYDTDGNALWARSVAAGSGTSEFYSVTVGSDGIYAAGYVYGTGTYTFGAQSITFNVLYPTTTGPRPHVVLVKYDTDGNAVWARSVTNPVIFQTSRFNSVAAGSDGVYAAGLINTNLMSYTFGTQSLVAHGALLVKYDPDGNVIWIKTGSSAGGGSRFNSVVEGSDGIYVAGTIIGNATYAFGTQSVMGTALTDNVLLVKYDPDGNTLWARSVAAGTSDSAFHSVAVGSDGLYAAGYIEDTGIYTFGDQSVEGTASADRNALLVKYDLDGNAIWARSVAAGTVSSEFFSVAAGSDGICAAGHIFGTGTYAFGSQSVTGTYAGANVVIVNYDIDGDVLWARSVASGAVGSKFNSVAAGSDGNYAGGVIGGNGALTFGTQSVAGISESGNVLLVKYQ